MYVVFCKDVIVVLFVLDKMPIHIFVRYILVQKLTFFQSVNDIIYITLKMSNYILKKQNLQNVLLDYWRELTSFNERIASKELHFFSENLFIT